MSYEQFSRQYPRPVKGDLSVKKDLSYDAISEIPARSLFNESFNSSSNFGNSFKSPVSRPELKNLRQERMMVRMSRSEANSPRLEASRNHFVNLPQFNKIFAHFETERIKPDGPVLKHSNSSKSIEDLETQWDIIKKQHNFVARTSLSPNRCPPSIVRADSGKSTSSQSDIDKKSLFDTRRGTNEKPVVSNLLSKVVPQAKINLIQLNDGNARHTKKLNTTSPSKQKTKSPLQGIYDKYNNIHKSRQSHQDESESLLSAESRSRSPSSNVSVDIVSGSFRSAVNEQKQNKSQISQTHTHSRSPMPLEQRRAVSPTLNEYRTLMKKTLHDDFGTQFTTFDERPSKPKISPKELLKVTVHTFSKHKNTSNVLEELNLPEKEVTSKNEPRETTPTKKFHSRLSQKLSPESGNASPISIPEGNRSHENMKISFGMPVKRENNHTIPSLSSIQDNEGGNSATHSGVRKNSPAYFTNPISPSRDIFTKGIQTSNFVASEEKANTPIYSLSPIRNVTSASSFDQALRKAKLAQKISSPVQDTDTKVTQSELLTTSDKEPKAISKIVVTKLNQLPSPIKKDDKLKKLQKQVADTLATNERRKMIQAEYYISDKDSQSSMSKEAVSNPSRAFKLAPGLRNNLSRREEREHYHYILNNLSNNESKGDSINVSLDKGQLLNNSQIAQTYSNVPGSNNTITHENYYVSNSLKSSFKSNDLLPTKPEANAKNQIKKEVAKPSNPKPQKFYYLPRNDENTTASTKQPQSFNAKGTIAKLIKSHQKVKR